MLVPRIMNECSPPVCAKRVPVRSHAEPMAAAPTRAKCRPEWRRPARCLRWRNDSHEIPSGGGASERSPYVCYVPRRAFHVGAAPRILSRPAPCLHGAARTQVPSSGGIRICSSRRTAAACSGNARRVNKTMLHRLPVCLDAVPSASVNL